MSDPGKAVFLSYASQDAEAAKKICDALRAAGVEVWFDQSELVGGDAWDQKIKKQIRECALFVPLITPATNARAEGYFRREWKQAIERTHDMADDVPFLFPIVIGDVTDATARVPDKFREVQWTRLKLEETPEGLAARISRLLAGAAPEDRGQGTGDRGRRTRNRAGRWQWWMIFPIIGTITGLMFGTLPLWRAMQGAPAKSQAQTPNPKSQTPTPAASDARALALKGQALFEKVDSTRDDYAAAEGLLQRAVALDPADGLILAIYSRLNTGYSMRGFDYSIAHTEEARSQMEQAMRLAPEESETWLARGSYLRRTNGSQAEAEVALRRALAMNPADTRPWFDLAWAVGRPGNDEEVFALLEKSIDPARPGSDALAHYNQFNLRFAVRRFAEADALARASVAELPSANFVAGLARNEVTWKGDARSAVAAMEQLTPERAKEPRSVFMTAYVRLLARNPSEALQSLSLLPTDFITDSYYTGPKAYWTGRAHQQLGNAEAAKVAWEAALAVSRREGAGRANRGLIMQAELLALLGREDEALSLVRAYEQAGGPQGGSRNNPWVYSAARVYAALGRVEEALPLLEAHFTAKGNLWPLTRALFRVDPIWDRIRDDPQVKELLARIEAAEIAALPPRDWPKNPELKRAVTLLDGLQVIPEDFKLAEEITQAVLDKSPTDPETVVAMARVHSMWLLRGWDRSSARFQKAKNVSERALQLAPDEPEALQAMAIYLYTRGVENQRALDLAQRAVELAPQVPRFYRQRDNCLFVLNFSGVNVFTDQNIERQNTGLERAIDSARRTTELFPRDPLVHYELSRHYRDLGRWAEFEKATDATLALAPVPNAITWKARGRLGLYGDLAGMKALLDQVPARVRSVERAVFGYFLYSVYTGQTSEGLESLNGVTGDWMIDFDYRGPKALPMAVLLEIDGKKELARLQYEAALAELKRARTANPSDIQTYLVEAWIQHGLGHAAEARAALRVFNESIPRPFTVSPMGTWWFQPIAANLLMGERETALALMREAVANFREGRATLRSRFALDRRMAPFRDDPEIKALLAEPEAKP